MPNPSDYPTLATVRYGSPASGSVSVDLASTDRSRSVQIGGGFDSANQYKIMYLNSERRVIGRAGRYDLVSFIDQNGKSNEGNITFDIRGAVRSSNNNGYDPVLLYTKGIAIKTFDNGDDLIYPNGRGYSGRSRLFRHEVTNVDWDYDRRDLEVYQEKGIAIDRQKQVWVNPGNGIDVVVGGYGHEVIGSSLIQIDPMISILKKPLYQAESTASGSKFYIGGSDDDVLLGGKDADYLIGDRFNEYELYLPKSILDTNITQDFLSHKSRIEQYQNPFWEESFQPKGTDRFAGRSPDDSFNGVNIPLWRPGNDVIYGHGGNDIIYGDENAEDNLALLANFRKVVGNATTNYKADGQPFYEWSSNRLGDDFLDGGSGDDQIFGGWGSDAIIGGLGSDFISCGDQIIAPGYEPLWGPKIIWGDEYNPQYDKSRTYSPDVYMIGGTYSTSSEIENSESGIIDSTQLRETISERMKSYADAWKNASGYVSKIPKVGDYLKKLGDAFFKYAVSYDVEVPVSGKSPKPLDALTIIKDFDPADQLVMRLAPGESFGEVDKSENFQINTFGYEKFNSLASDSIGGPGKMLIYAKGASEQYDRVFLQGYTGSLHLLNRYVDPKSGDLVLYFGGSDYAGI